MHKLSYTAENIYSKIKNILKTVFNLKKTEYKTTRKISGRKKIFFVFINASLKLGNTLVSVISKDKKGF